MVFVITGLCLTLALIYTEGLQMKPLGVAICTAGVAFTLHGDLLLQPPLMAFPPQTDLQLGQKSQKNTLSLPSDETSKSASYRLG